MSGRIIAKLAYTLINEPMSKNVSTHSMKTVFAV